MFLWVALSTLSVVEPAYSAGLIVNESLANEPGSVTSLEWVELLNWPDSGDGFVNLKGYQVVDGRDTTKFDTSLTIPPGGFVILARKTTGTGSFESYWGNNSGVWGDAPSESYPVVAAKIALRNTNDTVTLLSPVGDTSRMIWARDGGDGISIERIRPNYDDGAGNFAFCRDPSGSTPGRTNSVFPVRGDLTLDSLHVLPIDPRWSDTLTLVAYITNVGLGAVASAQIEAYDDAIPSQTGDSLLPVGTVLIPSLDELAHDSVIISWPNPSPGPHAIIARIVADGSSLNNTASANVMVRFSQPLVIVTEFLANPTVGGPDEWIEISNRAGFPINMTGVRIGDSSATSPLPDSVGVIAPGEFWVIAENETAFRMQYPAFTGRLLSMPSWHELNNTGDRIRLIGAAGEIIDSVSFRTVFADNRSTERTDLLPALAPAKYWKGSIDPSGGTPGRSNSVFPIYNDLSLDSLSFSPLEPIWGQAITVSLFATNTGLGVASGVMVDLTEDVSSAIPGAAPISIGSAVVPSLDETANAVVEIQWDDASPGIHHLIGRIRQDGDSLNNIAAINLTIRHSKPLVIISEFLANPTATGPGEWVEISNQADFPINMTGARIGDSSETMPLPSGVGVIDPLAFWVLCENSAAFRGFYAGFSGTLVEVPRWRSFHSSGDRIRLVGAGGEIIDSVSFRLVFANNRSVERTDLSATFAPADFWKASADSSGSTPGRANSVFPIYDDLALDSLSITPLAPIWGQSITVNVYVTNMGLGSTSGIACDLFEDLNLSSPGTVLEKIASGEIPPLEEGASASISIAWDNAPPGIHRLVGRIRSDGDSLNNTSATVMTVRYSRPLAIISEYLANPTVGGPGEWVEISNQADFPLNMTATKLGDSSEMSPLPPSAGTIAPGAYWVLCESEAAFRRFYTGFTGTLFEIDHWRELNNGGDRIRLLGAADEIIDSVSYRAVCASNHSVERLELSATFAGADDWAESVNPSGATPGRANSVSRAQAGPFQVTVSPNPIYLSAGQPAQIEYRMEIGRQLTLKIFDRAGHLVRTIADRTPAATGTTSWDGADDRGGKVRPGLYILLARSDPDGTMKKIAIAVGP